MERSRVAFVNGHFASTVVLGAAFMEQQLVDATMHLTPERQRPELDDSIKAVRQHKLFGADPLGLLPQAERLGEIRKAYVHRKRRRDEWTVSKRSRDQRVHPDAVRQEDTLFVLNVRPRPVRKKPSLQLRIGILLSSLLSRHALWYCSSMSKRLLSSGGLSKDFRPAAAASRRRWMTLPNAVRCAVGPWRQAASRMLRLRGADPDGAGAVPRHDRARIEAMLHEAPLQSAARASSTG